MSSFEFSDLERRVASLLRYGTVQEADYAAARVRVAMGGAVTHWLPWITLRAGGDRSWWAPEPGEQVLVLSPGGDTARGVALGGIFQTAHPAPADRASLDRRVYADGAVIEYDREAHRLHALIPGDAVLEASRDVDVRAGGRIGARAGTRVEITAPQIVLSGSIVLDGPLTQGGGANGGDAVLNGALHVVRDVTTDADVRAAVSLNEHTHRCPHGGDTGGPQ